MIIYHEASPNDTKNILKDGLQRTSKGLRSQEQLIVDTNTFLDNHRPANIVHADIWRTKSIYGFVGHDDWIIEIKNGNEVPLSKHLKQTQQSVFKVMPALHCCYLSDLDLYDTVKHHVKEGRTKEATLAAGVYWNHLTPMMDAANTTIRRPEVMISCDLAPSELSLVTTS